MVFQPHDAFLSDTIEMKGIGFLYAGWFLLKHKYKYTKVKDFPFVFGIIVAMQRFINICRKSETVGKNKTNHIEKINTFVNIKTTNNDKRNQISRHSTRY